MRERGRVREKERRSEGGREREEKRSERRGKETDIEYRGLLAR